MPNAALSHSTEPSTIFAGTRWGVAVVLAVWFMLIMGLGASGAFVTPLGTPPIPMAIGVGAPVVLFLGGLWTSRAFREFALAADVRLMVGIQAWRFAGLVFIVLYTYGVLPGIFAWTAGLGDIAIGVTAPWILFAILRRPGFAASKTFVVWNVLGLLDLVNAVSIGALSSALATGAVGEVTTAPMAQLPLLLIPAYFVPIFFMLHVAALIQARRLAQNPAASRI